MLDHTARQIERDRERALEAQEGKPIRPHSTKLYPKVHVVASGREVWVAFRPEEFETMTRIQAHKLYDQLGAALGTAGRGAGDAKLPHAAVDPARHSQPQRT